MHAEVDQALLPIAPGATLQDALHGGEDYELLFTAAEQVPVPRRLSGTAIHRIVPHAVRPPESAADHADRRKASNAAPRTWMGAPPMTLDAPTLDTFPRTWKTEVLRTPPLIAPARQFVYPRQVPGEEDTLARGALLVNVKPCGRGELSGNLRAGLHQPESAQRCCVCNAQPGQLACSGGWLCLPDRYDGSRGMSASAAAAGFAAGGSAGQRG